MLTPEKTRTPMQNGPSFKRSPPRVVSGWRTRSPKSFDSIAVDLTPCRRRRILPIALHYLLERKLTVFELNAFDGELSAPSCRPPCRRAHHRSFPT
jgi:hypothetical protein